MILVHGVERSNKMIQSILTSIKKLLGIEDEYVQFDPDIIMHINSVFMVLNDIGVGPKTGFSIQDKLPTWSDFLGTDPKLEAIKSYIYLKVRLLFDPPSNSFLIEAMERQIKEFEWRLSIKEVILEEEVIISE